MSLKRQNKKLVYKAGWYALVIFSVLVWIVILGDVAYYIINGGK